MKKLCKCKFSLVFVLVFALLFAFAQPVGTADASGEVVLQNVDTVMIYNPLLYTDADAAALSTGTFSGIQTGGGTVFSNEGMEAASTEPEHIPVSQGDMPTLDIDQSGGGALEDSVGEDDIEPAAITVGSTQTFFYWPDMSEDYAAESVTFTCQAVGDYCYVWGYGYSDTSMAQTMAAEFDDKIYPSDHDNFGEGRYMEDGEKLNILVYSMSPSGICGFFWGVELYTAAELGSYSAYYNCGLPIIHVNSYWCTVTRQATAYCTLAHEYQHLICFSSALANPNNYDTETIETWLNESMSMKAEELVYPGEVVNEGYVNVFNSSTSIKNGQSLYNFNTDSDIGPYGEVFLFSEYTGTQGVRSVGEDGVFKDIHDYWRSALAAGLTEGKVLQSVMPSSVVSAISAHVTYSAAIESAIGDTDNEWLSKYSLAFQIALILQEESGIYSSSGNCSTVNPLLYSSTSACSIQGGGRIFVATTGDTFTIPSGADEKLIYVGFKDGEMTVAPTTAADYVPYTITAISNNEAYGTVSLNGDVITASPALGYTYADPAYTVVSGSGVTVSQSGDEFTVTTTEDCTVRINFAPREVYTLSYYANGDLYDTASVYAGDALGTLPVDPTVPEGYAFIGWTTALVAPPQADEPALVGVSYEPAATMSLYAVYATAAQGDDPRTEWVERAISGFSASDTVVITMKDSLNRYFAMSNANGTASAPAATQVTVVDGKITSTMSGSYLWNIASSAGNYSIYPGGSATTWLYCNNLNNGVRVGTGSANVFTLSGDYLRNVATSRYLGVYNSTSWNCYTSTSNISNQVLTLFKATEVYDLVYSDYSTTLGNFTLSYNANGTGVSGLPDAVSELSYGERMQISSTAPSRTGYTFQGWAENATAEVADYQPEDGITMTGDMELFAVWQVETYAVTWATPEHGSLTVLNDATPVLSGDLIAYGTALTITATADDRYALASLTVAGEAFTSGDSYQVVGSTVIAASFSQTIFTVTYAYHYSGADEPYLTLDRVDKDATLSAPADPSREGYFFLGWYQEEACANPWVFGAGGTQVTADCSIFAKWQKDCWQGEESMPIQRNGVYQISSPAELAWFAALVNGTLTDGTPQDKAADAVLTEDIDLGAEWDSAGSRSEGTLWTPIGNSSANAYAGSFDGQGHLLRGLCVNLSGAENGTFGGGFFGDIASAGSVRNLGLSSAAVTVVESGVSAAAYAGALAGLNAGYVENCFANALVYASAGVSAAGGLAGGNSGNIQNCYSLSQVDGTSFVGGVTGVNSATEAMCYYLSSGVGAGVYGIGGTGGDTADVTTAKSATAMQSAEFRDALNGWVYGQSPVLYRSWIYDPAFDAGYPVFSGVFAVTEEDGQISLTVGTVDSATYYVTVAAYDASGRLVGVRMAEISGQSTRSTLDFDLSGVANIAFYRIFLLGADHGALTQEVFVSAN